MSELGMTASQISAAGAYARSERLAAESIPVRAIDPTRQRFQVKDQDAADRAAADQVGAEADADGADGQSGQFARGKSAAGGGGSGLLGAVTAFLARLFSQADGADDPAPTPVSTGLRAYARAAASVETGNHGGMEVLSPSFPRLSSGRALDLSV